MTMQLGFISPVPPSSAISTVCSVVFALTTPAPSETTKIFCHQHQSTTFSSMTSGGYQCTRSSPTNPTDHSASSPSD